jgi:alpha-galactosidase
LSLSPGPASVEQADFLIRHAQLWRISDDFWDKWSDIVQQFSFMRNWYKHKRPGSWPDADMLPLEKIGLRAERGNPRLTNFTKDEQVTLMTLWSMFRSPLMFGGNLPDNDEFTLSLITNEEVLTVNQNSENNQELFADENKVVWTANVPGTNEKYIAMFNISDHKMKDAKIKWKDINSSFIKYSVRNLWKGKDLGVFIDEYTVNLEPHGCVLVRIKPIEKK